MKKKGSEGDIEELQLFDLPLREAPAKAPRPRRPAPAATAATSTAGPGVAATTASGVAPGAASGVAPGAAPSAADVQLELGGLDEIAETAPSLAAKARLGDRFFAGLADLLVHAVTVGVAALAVYLLGHPVGLREALPLLVFGLLFSFLYSVFSLAFWGQTPGMAWAGLLARSVTGEPLTFGQTVLRWLGGLFTLAFAGLPLLLALVGGRSLADRVSDSKTLQLA